VVLRLNAGDARECEQFLQFANLSLSHHYTSKMNALWGLLTSGDGEWLHQFEQHEQAYQQLLAAPSWRTNIEAWMKQERLAPLMARQLAVLHHEMLEHQGGVELRSEIIKRWNALNDAISAFRTEFAGAQLTEKETLILFRIIKDEEKRKQLWHACMQLGKQVAPALVELIKIRNRTARENGFDNYYVMKLASQEMEADVIESVIHNLRDELGPAYRKVKEEIDSGLCERYGIRRTAIRSWHYEYPFFQSYDHQDLKESVELNKFIQGMGCWLEERGFPLHDVMRNMNISEGNAKSSANFCLSIDRKRDIRISCNVNPDLRGASILLHELGHAMYDQSYDPSLPFMLRQPSHPFLSEASALLLERFLFIPGWQEHLIGQSEAFVKSSSRIQREMQKQLLVKLFWTMTLVQFEQKLYEDPEQNLNLLWWNTVEEYQGITRPDAWDAPYWASKSHLSTLPASYYNYLLGEIAASQFQQYLDKRFGQWHGLLALQHLQRTLFHQGLSKPWQEMMMMCVQEPLNPIYMINQLRI
jgi:peptidyl-dipeptidase A